MSFWTKANLDCEHANYGFSSIVQQGREQERKIKALSEMVDSLERQIGLNAASNLVSAIKNEPFVGKYLKQAHPELVKELIGYLKGE